MIFNSNYNAGVKICTHVGDLGVFKVWINKEGIANLKSIPKLEKDAFRVTSDTCGEWIIYSPCGDKLVFKRENKGNLKSMPYINVGDVTEAFTHANTEASPDIEAIQKKKIHTIHMKMKEFSLKEVKGAIAACKAQIMLAHPPDTKLKQLVNSDSVENYPVIAHNITNSRVIFGPDLPGL